MCYGRCSGASAAECRDLSVLRKFKSHLNLDPNEMNLECGGLADFADLVYHHGPRALLSENPFLDRAPDKRAVQGTVQWYRDANGGDRGQEWYKKQGTSKGKSIATIDPLIPIFLKREVTPCNMLARMKATAKIYQHVLEVQQELKLGLSQKPIILSDLGDHGVGPHLGGKDK
ncbi:hypothetical protein T492DRAFT_1113633 [Pavlovales sp. CCMP2436]|nr:hypothetical protein T492DRAFT_1113633 [Pavlovales sp. CCMP2436]